MSRRRWAVIPAKLEAPMRGELTIVLLCGIKVGDVASMLETLHKGRD